MTNVPPPPSDTPGGDREQYPRAGGEPYAGGGPGADQPAPGAGQAPYGQPGQEHHGNPPYGQAPYGQQQYGQQPSPGQPPYGGARPAAVQTLSITSMVTGIAGIVFCWVPVLGLLAAIAAIVTGHMAQRREPAAKPFWLTGIITGYVGLALNLILGALFLFLLFVPLWALENLPESGLRF